MALFKVCRGKEVNLPSVKTDGYAYFCTDTKNFYIDWDNGSGVINRDQINGNCANKVRYLNGEQYVEIDAIDINKAVSHLSNMQNPHNSTAEQVGAVPISRTVNGKSLSDDISLSAPDVGAVAKDGSVAMVGDLPMGGNKITSVGSPTSTTDATNKTYVDNEINNVKTIVNSKTSKTDIVVSLPVSGWSDLSQTVSVSEATSTNTVFVASEPSCQEKYAESNVLCIGQGDGTLTFKCDIKPSVDLQANIVFFQ